MKTRLITSILLIAFIITFLFCSVGCAEVVSETPLDTDFIAAHDEVVTDYEYKYNALEGEFVLVPVEEMARIAYPGIDDLKTVFSNINYAQPLVNLYKAGYRKQSDGETITKYHIQAHYEAIYALADMVCQFGYSTTFRKQKAVCDGGLSALEYAFGALLDCGCKLNSNGTITLKNLFAFQEEMGAKMEGGE